MSDYGVELAKILGSHVGFGPLLWWPLLSATAGFLGMVLRGWLRSRRAPGPEEHWSLRARWAHECRTAAVRTGIVVVMSVGFLSLTATQPLGLSSSAISVLSMAAAAAGVRGAFVAMHPSLTTATTAYERFANFAFGPGTLYPWAIAPLVWAPFVTSTFDHQTGAVLTLAVTLHFAWGSLALPFWRALGLVTPPTKELDTLVRDTAAAAQTPLSGVMVWRWRTANAFALVGVNQIAVTERLIELLSPEELRGVVQHELAHLREPRWMYVVRLCMALLPLSLLLLRPLAGTHGILGVFGLLAALTVALAAGSRALRSAESTADAGAHGGEVAPAYARALEKLHEDRLLPAAMSGDTQRSHPDLYDRMLAAGVTPEFPKPAPPPSRGGVGYFLGLVVVFALVGFAAGDVRSAASTPAGMATVAWVVTPSPEDLLMLDVGSTQEPERSLVALGLETSRDPDAWFESAWYLAIAGDCVGVAVLTDAAERKSKHDETFAALHARLSELPGSCHP